MLLTALVAAALIGACGSGGPEPGSAASAKTQAAHDKALTTQFNKLALQDKAVQATSGLTAEQRRRLLNRRRLVEAIRVRWEQRGIAVSTARQVVRQLARSSGNRTRIVRTRTVGGRTVVHVFSPASFNICAPIGPRGGSKAQRMARRARELQRKQVLYYLNLSCPSL
jgi:hypothetical protein